MGFFTISKPILVVKSLNSNCFAFVLFGSNSCAGGGIQISEIYIVKLSKIGFVRTTPPLPRKTRLSSAPSPPPPGKCSGSAHGSYFISMFNNISNRQDVGLLEKLKTRSVWRISNSRNNCPHKNFSMDFFRRSNS